jgi:hypothetical protein
MFVEKLKTNDFEKFASQFGCSVSEIKNNEDKSVYVKFSNDAMGPQPEFNLSDFYCRASGGAYYAHTEKKVENLWRKFLENSFGKSYSKALIGEMEKELARVKNEILYK